MFLQVFYLIFCRSVWHFPLRLDCQLYVQVLFNQIAPDYLEGLLLVLPNEQLPQEIIVSTQLQFFYVFTYLFIIEIKIMMVKVWKNVSHFVTMKFSPLILFFSIKANPCYGFFKFTGNQLISIQYFYLVSVTKLGTSNNTH